MASFIDSILNSEAIPVLQRTVQFAARRHEVIAHNIANLSTPNFQTKDLPVAAFQKALGEAVDRKRQTGPEGPLEIRSTRDVRVDSAGNLAVRPTVGRHSVLAHDRNNRDLERSMQDLTENAGAYRLATDLLKSRFAQLDLAIRMRM